MNPFYMPIFFMIAAVYSSAGLGGGTAYLAILSLLDIPYAKIRATALFLKILCVTTGFYNHQKAGYFNLKMLIPFVISSIPAAFIGSFIRVPEKFFFFILAAILFLVALRMLMFHTFLTCPSVPSPSMSWVMGLVSSAIMGLLGGMIGIGGGILLTPFLLLLGWSNPKQAAALSGAFILFNSLSGFIGHTLKGSVNFALCLLLGLAVILGSYTSSFLRARKLSPAIVQRIFAVLLIIVVWKLIGRAL